VNAEEERKGSGERRACAAGDGEERVRGKERAHTEPVEERRYPERRGDGGPGEHGARLDARIPRRVLPTPPGPVRFNKRTSGRRAIYDAASTSLARPIKGVS
jgi:hypothetical protein